MKFILGLYIGACFGFIASACLKVASDYDKEWEESAEEFLERCGKC